MSKIKYTGRLENWYFDKTWNVIWGHIHDDIHNRFENGTYIHTSHVVKQTKKTVTTLNSRYRLGTPLWAFKS